MVDRVLTRRQLNRATLARQMLLRRERLPVAVAVARLVAVQAQVQNPPYIGLWTRLEGFRRDDLTDAMARREVVRTAAVRSTLHLLTAADYLALRPAFQPALERALSGFFGQRGRGFDAERLVVAARRSFAEPRTFVTIRALLSEIEPGADPQAMAYLVRTRLPLVQVPPAGAWGVGGEVKYALAPEWLDAPLNESDDPRPLILRHLAAFGPASVRDVQTWAGIARLKGLMEALRPELRTFRDEGGTELFDLPDAPLPDEDTPAPVRFLPEYDNLLLAHADRTRIIADAHRPKVFLTAGRVRATFLADGFVAGTWRSERTRGAATLTIAPFAPLPDDMQAALAEEGERLLRFIEDGAETFAVRFALEP